MNTFRSFNRIKHLSPAQALVSYYATAISIGTVLLKRVRRLRWSKKEANPNNDNN